MITLNLKRLGNLSETIQSSLWQRDLSNIVEFSYVIGDESDRIDKTKIFVGLCLL